MLLKALDKWTVVAVIHGYVLFTLVDMYVNIEGLRNLISSPLTLPQNTFISFAAGSSDSCWNVMMRL